MTLVGRSAEQEALSRLLASTRLGRGGAVVVTGEPGVGKTSLLLDAVEGLTDMRVLEVTGTQAEQDLPFAALHAVLLPALHLLGEIPAPQSTALGAALSLGPGDAGDRFAIGAATLSLLSRYADEAPVVVVVDDLQWVDSPSVDALAFAARRLREDPVALLLAGRSGEVPPQAEGLSLLEVEGLAPDAAGQLVDRVRPTGLPPDARELVFAAAGGNPLALLELAGDPDALGDLSEGLPPTLPSRLQAAFSRRLRRLRTDERDVALVAALAGGDVRLVRAACGELDLDPDALHGAVQTGLLTVRGGRVTFRHPVLRSVLYAASPEELRRRVHRAVADQLVSDGDADRRVWHLAAAASEPDEEVARLLEAFGARAAARTAYAICATALERAARLSPDPGDARSRLMSAAHAAWTGGQPERALALLDEVEPEGRQPTAAGLGLRATIAVRAGSIARGRDMFEEAAALAPPDERAPLLAEACRACLYLVDMASLRRVEASLSATLHHVVDPEARAIGLAASGASRVLLGEGGSGRLREAVPLLTEHVEPLDHPAGLPWLMLAPLFLRDAAGGQEARRLVDEVRARVGVGAMPNLLFHMARDQATSNAWARAAANYDEAVRLARETGQGAELAMSLAGMACLEARQGRGDECREHADEALERCRARSLHFGELWCLQALGDLALSEGATEQAVHLLERMLARIEELAVADPDLSPVAELVEALVRRGERGRATELAGALARSAVAKGLPWGLARAHRALALTADDETWEDLFTTALDHHARTRDVFETARTQLAYGGRLRRAGRRVDARPVLRAAFDAFDALGALLWAATTRAELEATGETVAPREPAGPGALTPQELQVCLLLAEGRTTREAAAALFLSPKTVEYHLRKAYTKLAVHSRAELASLLGTLS